MSKDSNTKEFSLRPVEMNLLNIAQQQTMSLLLSYIAGDRLAYQVTPNTQFKVEGNKLFITEGEPEGSKEKENEDGEESVATA